MVEFFNGWFLTSPISLVTCLIDILNSFTPYLNSTPLARMEDDHPVKDNLEAHVLSKAFDEECAAFAKRRYSSSDDSDTDSDVNSLWSNNSTSSSVSSVEPSPYDVPKLEAYLYYAGLSGPNGRGPKLVYRMTREKEKFVPPTGPEAYRRLMKLRTVPENHKLGKDNLWDYIRAEVHGVLDAQHFVD
ncbi:hypothetical protein FRC02_008766 [Tulasnella sp. 418]|nr:hypothetical protein FRC02_008766 [Tulasnella sp. 418]